MKNFLIKVPVAIFLSSLVLMLFSMVTEIVNSIFTLVVRVVCRHLELNNNISPDTSLVVFGALMLPGFVVFVIGFFKHVCKVYEI